MKKLFKDCSRFACASILAVLMAFGVSSSAISSIFGHESHLHGGHLHKGDLQSSTAAQALTVTPDSDNEIDYVVLGDSMTNGFCLSGYYPQDDSDEGNVYGYKVEVPHTYPSLFKNYLASQYPDKTVNLHQLAISGMRAEELHFLLDPEYGGDLYTEEKFNAQPTKVKDGSRWFHYIFNQRPGFVENDFANWGNDRLRAEYTAAIKDAEVISINLGANNFGSFLTSEIEKILIGEKDYEYNFNDIFSEEVAEQLAPVHEQLLNEIKLQLGEEYEELADLANEIVETIVYVYAGFIVHYTESIKLIRELNPNAQLMIVSLVNNFNGLSIKLNEDTIIPLDDYYEYMVDLVNLYMTGLDTLTNTGYPESIFVNLEDIHIIVNEIAELDPEIQSISATNVLERKLVASFVEIAADFMGSNSEDVLEALNEKSIIEAVNFAATYNPENELTYEQTMQLVISEIYLGFRKAIIQCSSNPQLNVESVINVLTTGEFNISALEITQIFAQNYPKVISGERSALANAIAKLLAENDVISTFLYIVAHLTFADGMGTHPTNKGHGQITDFMINAWEQEITTTQYFYNEINNAVGALNEWLSIHGSIILEDSITIRDGYEVSEDSYYLSIGDKSIADANSYTHQFASMLGIDVNTQHEQLSQAGMRAEDLHLILDETYLSDGYADALFGSNLEKTRKAYIREIEAADLITLSFGSDSFTAFINAQIGRSLLNVAPYEMNWLRLVGEEGMPYVDSLIAELNAYLTESGVLENIPLGLIDQSDVQTIVESLIYSYLSYTLNITQTVDKIHEINPEAQVVIIGLYNPLPDLAFNDVVIGSYFDYLVDISNANLLIYAMQHSNNTTFIRIKDASLLATGETNLLTYLISILLNPNTSLPMNAEIHEYVANKLYTSAQVYGHVCVYGEWQLVADSTCANQGEERRYCTLEGCEKYQSHKLPLLEHEYESVVTAPTCTERGYTTYTCVNCNHTYNSTYTSAKNHSFSTMVYEKRATCYEKGEIRYYCTNEGCTEYESIEVNTTSHDYGSWVLHSQATCGQNGEYRSYCQNDGCTHYDIRSINATGRHSYGDWAVTTEATCTKGGVETRECQTCDKTETKDISATGEHSFGDWTVTLEATCAKDGVETKKCQTCDKTETRTINATGEHVYGDWTVTLEATCAEDGVETRKCQTCDKTETREINATGEHSYGDWIVTKPATVDEAGEQQKTCSTCGDVISEEIAKLPPTEGGNQDDGNQDGGNQDGGNQDDGNQDGGNQDGENKDDEPSNGILGTVVIVTLTLIAIVIITIILLRKNQHKK